VILTGGTNGTVSSIAGSASYYRLQLSITRNAGSGLDFVVSMGNNTTTLTTAYSLTDASPVTTTFDEVVIFNGVSTTAGFRVDNVLVTTAIPEPSAAFLLALGCGAAVLRRRR